MRILVTGATANVGRLVVDHLLEAGAQVRALTNNPQKAALPPEVEVIEGYLGRISTMPAALEGVERMYLAPLARTVREVVAMAKEAGVRRIVDLSSTEAEISTAGDPWGMDYYLVEQAVEDSGILWTHLRAGEFMTNMLEWAEMIRANGVVRQPYGRFASAPIDLDDIAAVAARALLEDGHCGQKYILTGPEALSRIEMAHLIGEAIGREVRFEEQPHAEALAELELAMGQSAEQYLNSLAQSVDQPQTPSSAVATITGRPATTFAQWAARHAALFR